LSVEHGAPEVAAVASMPPHTIDHGPVLSLDTQAEDDVLTFQRPGDEVDAKEQSVGRGGPACIQETRLICISVDHQLEGGRAS
jgi:hypothetical protein